MKKVIGEYVIDIQTVDVDSPRVSEDNLGTMVCFGKRYSLGESHSYKHEDYSGWDELKKSIIKNENVGVILPLYMYDHGGTTISTTPFSDKWDSGQIGFIYASKDIIKYTYGTKIVTKKSKELALSVLKAEVDAFNKWINGEVFGYVVTKNDEEVGSCFGYFDEDECFNAAKESIDVV